MATRVAQNKDDAATRFDRHAEKLSLLPRHEESEKVSATAAVQALFVTPQDPVIETADGGRLPAVPLVEAQILNELKSEAEGRPFDVGPAAIGDAEEEHLKHAGAGKLQQNKVLEGTSLEHESSSQSTEPEAPLGSAIPPSRTNPLFPPLPLYGPPTFMRNVHCNLFRCSSFFLSLAFLAVIVLGSAFTSIPLMFRYIGLRLTGKDPDARRPFHNEEKRRKRARREAAHAWTQRCRRRNSMEKAGDDSEEGGVSQGNGYTPTEGGDDPLICDVGYYARRVGLDIEEFRVQTEDGFIIQLWHVFNPKEYSPVSDEMRRYHEPVVFPEKHTENGRMHGASGAQYRDGNRRYPVLLVHGLLQSSGAYCCNDEDSFAFFLCKRYAAYCSAHLTLPLTVSIVASMSGLATIAAASTLNIRCSPIPIHVCGRGTSARWVSWTSLPSSRVFSRRPAFQSSASSATRRARPRPLLPLPKSSVPTSAPRSASSAPWPLPHTQAHW